jgi:hypothetical protein
MTAVAHATHTNHSISFLFPYRSHLPSYVHPLFTFQGSSQTEEVSILFGNLQKILFFYFHVAFSNTTKKELLGAVKNVFLKTYF